MVVREYDQDIPAQEQWGWFQNAAYGCKFVIEASDELNGVL